MSIDPNHKRVTANYLGDDGHTYAITTTAAHAAAAGMSGAAPGTPSLPRGWKARHLNLLAPDGIQKAKLVISSPTGFAGAIGAGISIAGLGDFICTGTTGSRERRGAPSF